MRILHLSTTDLLGGAGRAAHRIHRAMLDAGADSRMWVQSKSSTDDRVQIHPIRATRIAANLFNRCSLALLRRTFRPTGEFSPQLLSGFVSRWQRHSDAELVHLHWISDGFLGIANIGRIAQPLVWTCHDQWPFTGGCHYSGTCERFVESCGLCPLLGAQREGDLSRFVHREKVRRWRRLRMAVVCPSRWMANLAASSSLFRNRDIRVIPNPLDLARFRPTDPDLARIRLGIDRERPTVLFVAMGATTDHRKGLDLLAKTIASTRQSHKETQLIVIGASEPDPRHALDPSTQYLGRIHDDAKLALAYSAANVFVAPSREDNFPNTVAESLACGTPVAAFRVGGLAEMVNHQETGYLAEPFDCEDLARGITELLRENRISTLAGNARQSALKLFSPETAARRYLEVYQHVVDKRPDPA